MRCAEFDERLQQLLDDVGDAALADDTLPIALQTHVKRCAECRTRLAGYRSLFAGLAAMPRPKAAVNLAQRVMAANATSAPRTLQRYIAPLATAAMVAIVVGVAFVSREVAEAPSRPSVAEALSTHTTPAVQPIIVKSTGPRSIEPISQTPLLFPERDLQTNLSGVGLSLPGFGPVTVSAEVIEAHFADQPAWMVEVTDELKPLTSSMTGTLNVLLRAWPGNDDRQERDHGARYDRYSQFDRIA